MNEYGYAAAYSQSGHFAAVLELRCSSLELSQSQAFIELANYLCRLTAENRPQYLSSQQISEDTMLSLAKEAKRETLRRGIPDNLLESYSHNLLQKTLTSLCLLALPVTNEVPEDLKELSQVENCCVAQLLQAFQQKYGEVVIAHFYGLLA